MGDALIASSPRIRLIATCGSAEGRGHVGRALAIADALVARGAAPELVLLRGALGDDESGRAASIGLAVVDTAPDDAIDAFILDVPDVAEQAAALPAERLLVIDDRDALASPAAVVVQPSQATWRGHAAVGRVLEGYRYAAVGPAYRHHRDATERPATARRGRLDVLVCFGGSDPADVTGRLAPHLDGSDRWQATIILGAGARPSTDPWPGPVLRDPPDLADRMAATDVALLGAGTMKFEAACLARPALLVAAADDQLAVGPAWASTGAADYLGDGRTIDPMSVMAAIDALVADPARRTAMSTAGWDTVDGHAADRIAEAALAVAAAGRAKASELEHR